jgi:4-amino-4-deoxy-L-arabinose transferase-like glycosyltransferase
MVAAKLGWRRPPGWKLWEIGALVPTVALGAFLRFHDYTLAPVQADNQDELAWAWAGLTLITRHVPYSWSYLPSYHDIVPLEYAGTTFPIIHPYLDHPPLFNLLVGGWAWLSGARDLTDVTIQMIRPVAIVLGLLSLLLLYVLGRRVIGRETALVATILLATAPVAVMFSRQVESEALLTPLLLVALILCHRVLTGEGRTWTVAGLALVCTAASLTKVPGVAVGIGAAAVLVSAGRWWPGVLAGAGGIAGLLLYAAYGALIDWHQFLLVLQDQEGRRHGVMAAYEYIAAPAGLGRGIRDGWWILGWVGLGAILAARARSQARLLVWPALVFALAIMLLADQRLVVRFGWYRIPVYPVAYCGAGYLAWLALRRADFAAMLAVLLLGGATVAAMGVSASPWMPPAWALAAAAAIPLVPALLAQAAPDVPRVRALAQGAIGAALVVMVLLNTLEAFQLAQVYTQL